MPSFRLIHKVFLLIFPAALLVNCSQVAVEPVASEPAWATTAPSLQSAESFAESPADVDPYAQIREEMVVRQIIGRGVTDPAVLAAMRVVPRHLFVPTELINLAYHDNPLPIGLGQTISQPYIVALMTEALKLEPGMRVLEIGTGSGYQAAVLAEMGMQVYTIEILPELAEHATETLTYLGYTDVHTLTGDGYFGWEENAPFDRIIVTAAPDHLPQPLARQLIEGGRLVIPIGPVGAFQTLWLFEKIDGELQATNLGGVSFVPLTGEHE